MKYIYNDSSIFIINNMDRLQTIWIIWKLWSWKDSVWDYISNLIWWQRFELSRIVKNEANDLWIDLTRDNLIWILRAKHNIHWKWYLVDETLKLLDWKWIITWIRLIEQISTLRVKTNSILMYVDCERELRFQRQLERMKKWDLLTIDEMDKVDSNEESDLWTTYFQDNVRNLVDIVIDNNWTEENTRKQVDLFLKNRNFII